MKHLLGYVIWNKAKMIEAIIDGIVNSFDPGKVDIAFLLDNPTDGTEQILSDNLHKLSQFKGVYPVTSTINNSYKFYCQNILLHVASRDGYDTLICPQDDQIITDPDLVKNIEWMVDWYGPGLGIIGCRDGFDYGYGNMVSSEWSEAQNPIKRIPKGQHEQAQIVNDGPLIYPIETIRKIGLHDTHRYKRFYIEDDYCMRCNAAGLRNFVIGNSLIHDRTISSIASDHYSSNFGEQDLKAFKEKWNV